MKPVSAITRKSKQINVRLPDGMREELNRVAAENGRKTNTEIVMRLERSLDESQESTVQALREYLETEFAAIREDLAKTRELILRKK